MTDARLAWMVTARGTIPCRLRRVVMFDASLAVVTRRDGHSRSLMTVPLADLFADHDTAVDELRRRHAGRARKSGRK
jgi:hypothetical protein